MGEVLDRLVKLASLVTGCSSATCVLGQATTAGYFDAKISYRVPDGTSSEALVKCAWSPSKYFCSEQVGATDVVSECKLPTARFSVLKIGEGYDIRFRKATALGLTSSPETGLGKGTGVALGLLPENCKFVRDSPSYSEYKSGSSLYLYRLYPAKQKAKIDRIEVLSAKAEPILDWKFEYGVKQPVPQKSIGIQADGTIIQVSFSAGEFGRVDAPYSDSFEWYKKGNFIRDDRVPFGTEFTYEELVALSGKKAGLTPEELLRFSTQRASQQQSRQQADIARAASKKNEGSRQIYVIGGIALLAAVLTSIFILIKAKLQR